MNPGILHEAGSPRTSIGDADYFETMGIPIVRGRSFQSTDTASSGRVAVVNERFANTFWKGRDPIGQRIKPGNDQAPWFTGSSWQWWYVWCQPGERRDSIRTRC
jgi:hypothetical protein